MLLDSSKFGRQALLTFARLDQVQQLFTDPGIGSDAAALCTERGIRVVVA